MITLYKTMDGKMFRDPFEAQKHEGKIDATVRMWDWQNHPTTDANTARVVYLKGEKAAQCFISMCEDGGGQVPETYEIGEGDEGWYYWDEGAEQYHWLDPDIIKCLIANYTDPKN